MLRKIVLAGLLLFFFSPALQAQNLITGLLTPGHAVKILSPGGTLGDAGGAAGPSSANSFQDYLTELGISNSGLPFAIRDNPDPRATAYHLLALGTDSSGNGLISYNAFGGAVPHGLNINLNGTVYPFPGSGNGNVVGPNASINNNLPAFNGTNGALLKDSGIPLASVGYPFINVRAINNNACTGGDDTAAIQSAAALGIAALPPGSTCNIAAGATIAVNTPGGGIYGPGVTINCNGSGFQDCIAAGSQNIAANQVGYQVFKGFALNNASRTGGNALSIVGSNNDTTVEDVTFPSAYNGIFAEYTNTLHIRRVNGYIRGTYGLKWFTPTASICGPGGASQCRSDVLDLSSVVFNCNGGTGTAFLLDGFVATPIFMQSRGLNCLHELVIQNSVNSATLVPNSGEFYDFEADGGTGEAIQIFAGGPFKFIGGDINNSGDTTASDYTFHIYPDAAHSITRGIQLVGTYVHSSPGGILKADANGVVLSAIRLADGGKVSTATPALDVGANADDVTITGSSLGFVFGQPSTNNYSLQVESGAAHVFACNNNYRLNGGTGTVNNLAASSGASGLSFCNEGRDYQDSPLSAQSYNASPSNPAGTTSTSGVMMGLAGSITPFNSGKVSFTITGNITNNTNADGAVVICRFGTGAAPVNGAAETGSACSSAPSMVNPAASTMTVPFSAGATIANLTPWTTYWIDLELKALTGGTATAGNISLSAVEQ